MSLQKLYVIGRYQKISYLLVLTCSYGQHDKSSHCNKRDYAGFIHYFAYIYTTYIPTFEADSTNNVNEDLFDFRLQFYCEEHAF